MKKKNNKGFSLIELIIAVAILVVLSGLLAPQLIKYIEKSRESKDIQLLDSVYVAVNTALADETAYDAFTTDIAKASGSVYADHDTGIAIATISDNSGDAFAKEVYSVLGKAGGDLKLSSKKAAGTSIFVRIKTTSGNAELEVGVFAGTAKDAPTSGLTVGKVN